MSGPSSARGEPTGGPAASAPVLAQGGPALAAASAEKTGRETLEFFRALYGSGNPVAIGEQFGLAGHLDKRVRAYSGGLRQRLHLALGFLHAPEALLLDEPTAALDPSGAAMAWDQS